MYPYPNCTQGGLFTSDKEEDKEFCEKDQTCISVKIFLEIFGMLPTDLLLQSYFFLKLCGSLRIPFSSNHLRKSSAKLLRMFSLKYSSKLLH